MKRLHRSRGNPGVSSPWLCCSPPQTQHLLDSAKACLLKRWLFLTRLEANCISAERERVKERLRRWGGGKKNNEKLERGRYFVPFCSRGAFKYDRTQLCFALLLAADACALLYSALSISLKGLCAADPYNRVNAAVFEMINTKETRQKDKDANNKQNQAIKPTSEQIILLVANLYSSLTPVLRMLLFCLNKINKYKHVNTQTIDR